MKIVLDGIIYSLQRHGGITVYFNELLTRLYRANEDFEIVTFNPALGTPAHFLDIKHKKVTSRLGERYRPFRLPSGRSDNTIFHSSYYRLPSVKSVPSVVTVHDFVYERSVRGARRWIHSWQKFAAIRAAQAVICISQSTLDDLQEFVGVRQNQSVYVIHNGISDIFSPMTGDSVLKPFVLYVGQRGGYKNFDALVRCMPLLPELELRCVGGGLFTSDEFVGMNENVRQRIHHEGFVSDRQLNTLYNQAACLVYPSSYEGFGIPVVEAMKAGCPVVSIDCKAVREVGGAALVVANSLEPEDMCNAILYAIAPLQRELLISHGLQIANKYSWDKTYLNTLNVYRGLIS